MLVALIVVATLYEAADAMRLFRLPKIPGQNPPYETPIIGTTVLALVVGTAVFLFSAAAPRIGGRLGRARWLWAVPIACTAFVIARNYSYDPYYFPTLRRAGSSGHAPPWLFYAMLLAAALVIAWQHSRHPRIAEFVTSAVLLVTALGVLLADAGH
jgi:hypothetical protein